jgi:hypothetical protein
MQQARPSQGCASVERQEVAAVLLQLQGDATVTRLISYLWLTL